MCEETPRKRGSDAQILGRIRDAFRVHAPSTRRTQRTLFSRLAFSSLSRYDITHANESFPFAGKKGFCSRFLPPPPPPIGQRETTREPTSITRNRGIREIARYAAANINDFSSRKSRHRRRF